MAEDVLRKNAEAVAATTLTAASKACQQQVKHVSSQQKEAPEAVAVTKEAEWRAEADRESLAAPEQSALARLEFHGTPATHATAPPTPATTPATRATPPPTPPDWQETRDMRNWGAGEWCGSIKVLIRL